MLAEYDLSALRSTISIGEPWTPDAWVWFFDHVCKRRLPILNYAGGTECGGAILISIFLRECGCACFMRFQVAAPTSWMRPDDHCPQGKLADW